MKIRLANGHELNPIMVTGEKRTVKGARRDCLTFVFGDTGLDDIDETFNEVNCEKITVVEMGTKTVEKEIVDEATGETTTVTETVPCEIYNGYAIRVDLLKRKEEKKAATATEDAEYVTRVYVTMAERTYAETQLASLTETVDALVLESLMAE